MHPVHQIDEDGGISIESLVFIRTAQYLRGRPMFPSLKYLSLCDSSIILPLLVSPSLRDINLVEDNSSGSQSTLIQSICDGSPSLEYFGFCGDLERSSYELLSQLPYLHHLEIIGDVIPVDIIASLKSLTNLRNFPLHRPQTFRVAEPSQHRNHCPTEVCHLHVKSFLKKPVVRFRLHVTHIQNGAVTLAELSLNR
jgi:hypothetical protein